MTLERLVDDYVYRYHFKFYPVVDDGRLVGCIKLNQVKEIPREEWTNRTVADLAGQCSKDNTIPPDTDATRALALMRRSGNSRLMVAEGNTLVGIISLKDLLEFLSTKIDLGDDSHARWP